jgi:hypothetical protein
MSEQQPEDEATEAPTPEPDSEDSAGSELEDSGPGDIGDDKLPEDLQPTEDNPLARHPGQTGDEEDKIGAGVEGSDAENPSANMAYGSEDSNDPSEGNRDESD